MHVRPEQNYSGKHGLVGGHHYVVANQDGEMFEKNHRSTISKSMLNFRPYDIHVYTMRRIISVHTSFWK
jgi:hypothetical protein